MANLTAAGRRKRPGTRSSLRLVPLDRCEVTLVDAQAILNFTWTEGSEAFRQIRWQQPFPIGESEHARIIARARMQVNAVGLQLQKCTEPVRRVVGRESADAVQLACFRDDDVMQVREV